MSMNDSHEESAQGRWRDVKDLKDHVSYVKRQLTVGHWRDEVDTLKEGAGQTQNSQGCWCNSKPRQNESLRESAATENIPQAFPSPYHTAVSHDRSAQERDEMRNNVELGCPRRKSRFSSQIET